MTPRKPLWTTDAAPANRRPRRPRRASLKRENRTAVAAKIEVMADARPPQVLKRSQFRATGLEPFHDFRVEALQRVDLAPVGERPVAD